MDSKVSEKICIAEELSGSAQYWLLDGELFVVLNPQRVIPLLGSWTETSEVPDGMVFQEIGDMRSQPIALDSMLLRHDSLSWDPRGALAPEDETGVPSLGYNIRNRAVFFELAVTQEGDEISAETLLAGLGSGWMRITRKQLNRPAEKKSETNWSGILIITVAVVLAILGVIYFKLNFSF